MKTNTDQKYNEYRLLLDILYKYKDKQEHLEDTINALKDNPAYRALHSKDYLKRQEEELSEINLIIKALENHRDNI